jgi:hypothetical protein
MNFRRLLLLLWLVVVTSAQEIQARRPRVLDCEVQCIRLEHGLFGDRETVYGRSKANLCGSGSANRGMAGTSETVPGREVVFMSEYRNRERLHLGKLEEFATWVLANGYTREQTKSTYEVLRLRKIPDLGKPKQPPLIFHKHDRGDHATSWGAGTHLVNRWLASRRQTAA